MALTKIPTELSSTPGISDSSTSTAITIDSSGNVTFSGAVTATAATQSAGDNSTKIATTAYADAAAAAVVDAAPSTLDTLNELAAALGDDANFSTTVTNSIAAKAPIANPTFTGSFTSPGIDDNASSTAVTIDSSGRVGVGDTPNTNWRNDATDDVLMLGTEATLHSDAGVTTELWNNAYVNNSDTFKNISTRGASRYMQYSGAHKWFTAASASAGSTISTEINSSPKMVLDVSGNLGIATSSPSTKLHLGGTAPGDSIIRQDSTASGTNWEIGERAAGKWQIFEDDTDSIVATFMSSGNVGIGTESPDRNLHIEVAADAYLRVAGNRGNANDLHIGNIEFENTFGSAGVIAEMRAITGNSGTQSSKGQLAFYTDDGSTYAERMRIGSSGDLSLSDDNELFFNASSSSEETRLGWKYGGTLQSWIERDHANGGLAFGNQGSERMRIDSSGNLLVGNTDIINSRLGVRGTVLAATLETTSSNSGHEVLVLSKPNATGLIAAFLQGGTGVGTISVTASATSYNTSSDYRLKENIVDAEDAGELIDAIQVRQFDWKADGSHQRFGMVAQELTTVAPEAVSTPEDPDEMMGVDYSKLVPMLIKEIQSLRARINALES